MSEKQLRIVAPFHAHTGYSKMSRAVLRSALLAGYEVEAVEANSREWTAVFGDGHVERKLVPEIKPEIPLPDCQQAEVTRAMGTTVDPLAPTLSILLPLNLCTFPQYANGPMLGWTMTESDNLCRLWKHGCRQLDYLLAPSRYVLDTFHRVIPDVQSDLLSIPVDTRLWSTDEYIEEIRNRPPFLFLFVGTTSVRKNWQILMQAFAEEFAGESDKVGLLMKPSRIPEVAQMADWCREMGAWVNVDCEPRTDWSLAALYRAADVYVQPSSEGQGLTYLEAALCGKPSLALAGGGATDVVTEANGYTMPYEMRPLIGHMPQFYPRTHRFATCDIDVLRMALRRVYEEETQGPGKGEAARLAAAAFSCEAIAPRFAEAVERGVWQAETNTILSIPPSKPKWACAFGAWGDVFACCGRIVALLKERKMDSIGVIYYGSDSKIADWLRLQTWCREVIALVEPDKDEMTEQFGYLCQIRGYHSQRYLARLLKDAGHEEIDVAFDVALTQLRLNQQQEPQYWSGPRLSIPALQWAQETAESIGRPFYVLNPRSIASNKAADHWRYWSHAITWLLEMAEEFDVTFAFVCEQYLPWPEHPRLVNLTGQTKTMQDVLALSQRSEGIISTSNNLGIYAPIADIPGVVVCARTCGRETFYHRWMEHPLIKLLDFEDGLYQFMAAVRELFGVPDEVVEESRMMDLLDRDEEGVLA